MCNWSVAPSKVTFVESKINWSLSYTFKLMAMVRPPVSDVPQIVTTLRTKRDEMERVVLAYQKQLDQAKRDLVHIAATLAMFEASGDDRQVREFYDTHRLLRKGEIVAIAKAALAEQSPLDTRELSRRIAIAKGLDGNDAVLVQAIGLRAIRTLAHAVRRGVLGDAGRRRGVRMWKLA